jgi:hypothetical protein
MIIEVDEEIISAPIPLACFERTELTTASLGLTLAESQELLAELQAQMVDQQAASFVSQQTTCLHCSTALRCKSTETITMRTLFGKLRLMSPRFYTCACQPNAQQSFSPLASQLEERSTPELLYLQTKWAALMSYGLTIDLLSDILPLQISETSLRRQLKTLATRYEEELAPEQPIFIEGCQRD